MSTDLHNRTAQPSPDEGPDKNEKPKSSLSLAQVIGGALAAMTAAALGSRLSVAGTVVGAAFASIIAAVAGSIYTASLRRTSKHVSTVLAKVRPTTPGQPAAPVPGPSAATSADTSTETRTDWVLPAAPSSPAGATTSPQGRRSRIGWKPVLAGAVLIFAIAALALTGIELVTGHALSGGTGTTVGQVAEGRTEPSSRPTGATPSATPSRTASAEPTATPSSTPSSEPTAQPTPTESAAPSTTPTPSATPSSAASATPSPGASSTP